MKNKTELEYGKRYLFKGYIGDEEYYYSGKVREFAGQSKYDKNGKHIFKFVHLTLDREDSHWFDLRTLTVIECLDRDCE